MLSLFLLLSLLLLLLSGHFLRGWKFYRKVFLTIRDKFKVDI